MTFWPNGKYGDHEEMWLLGDGRETGQVRHREGVWGKQVSCGCPGIKHCCAPRTAVNDDRYQCVTPCQCKIPLTEGIVRGRHRELSEPPTWCCWKPKLALENEPSFLNNEETDWSHTENLNYAFVHFLSFSRRNNSSVISEKDIYSLLQHVFIESHLFA